MQAGVYRHYKGGYYQVLGVGQHTETDELLVVYIALSGAELPGPRIRVRPLYGPEGFHTPLTGQQGVLGTQQRFTYIGDQIR